jgi:hypothetical protein
VANVAEAHIAELDALGFRDELGNIENAKQRFREAAHPG